MGKTILAVLLATAAMFVFGMVFWMSPLPYNYIENTALDGSVQQALREHFPRSGTYFVPGLAEDMALIEELHEQGPLAMVHVTAEGRPVMAASIFAWGFLHQLAIVAVLAGLMSLGRPNLISYTRRLKFVAVAGLLAALMPLADVVWWYAPPGFPGITAVYNFLSVLVAGAVLAVFIKPRVEMA